MMQFPWLVLLHCYGLKLTNYWLAEYKSAEFRLNEPKSWLPASFKIPKQMRFWEENEHSKREEAAQKPVVPQKNEYTDFEEELLFKEHTVVAQTSRGYLSPAAINVIEQFSRYVSTTLNAALSPFARSILYTDLGNRCRK